MKINTPDTIVPFLPALLDNANNINNLGRITSKYVTKGPRDEACVVNALSRFCQMKDDSDSSWWSLVYQARLSLTLQKTFLEGERWSSLID